MSRSKIRRNTNRKARRNTKCRIRLSNSKMFKTNRGKNMRLYKGGSLDISVGKTYSITPPYDEDVSNNWKILGCYTNGVCMAESNHTLDRLAKINILFTQIGDTDQINLGKDDAGTTRTISEVP